MRQIATILFFSVCFSVVRAQPGAFDLSFGNSGRVVTDFGLTGDMAHAVVVQADGKVISGGTTFDTYGSFALTRHNVNGTPDVTFGNNGKVVTDFGTYTIIKSLAVQPDGKIVAAGVAYPSGFGEICLARYDANGNLDNNFNGNGKLTLPVQLIADAKSVVVLPDQKILVAGQTFDGSYNDIVLVRLNANGTLDASFNGNGKVITHIPGTHSTTETTAMIVQADGRIVTAVTRVAEGTSRDFAVIRYNNNGTLDATFNGTGIAITDVGSYDDFANALAAQADGKIIVAGKSFNGQDYDYALVRYNANGSLDLTYDGDGKVISTIGFSDDIATGIAIQNDGMALVAGYTNNYSRDNGITSMETFSLIRYRTDGLPDTGFGTNGKVALPVVGGVAEGTSLALFKSRIYVAGFFAAPYSQTGYDFVVAAYQNDALLLPLTLLNFSASLVDAAVTCAWQTARETNISHFVVQRSGDGVSFENAGSVSAKNNATATYQFKDNLSSALLQLPLIYYRLQMVDKDGTFTYSAAARVNLNSKEQLTVFPNPAHSFVYIKGKDIQKTVIADNSGKVVLIKKPAPAGNNFINIQHLPGGIYNVTTTDSKGNSFTRRLIIE